MDITNFTSDEPVTANETLSDRYNISDVASNEWKAFAMYTVEARAIPNMIDGLKPVQRFYLYSSIINSKKDFKKVSAVSGIISDYGYNHGETSAAGAGTLMAAQWNNNVCLIEGRGSFGTRLIQEAGAARYVYTRLHENFNTFIKDIELSPVHEDPEHEPPIFYLPTIPLVLINGTKGIATGFATNILPRCPKDIIKACNEYITKGKITKQPQIKFPDFKGVVKYEEAENRHYITGIFERKGRTGLTITEVPYGFDREGYVKVLDKLEEDGDIVSYDDLCDKSGFKFDIKLKQQISAKWTNEVITKKFKLVKPMTENLTVIDYEGKLREYNDARKIVADFCDYKLGTLQKRIDLNISQLSENDRWLQVKYQFINAVIDDNIIFKNKNKKQVTAQTLANTDATKEDVDRLLRINIMSLTSEMVTELKKQQVAAKTELKFWNSTTTKEQFLSDLNKL